MSAKGDTGLQGAIGKLSLPLLILCGDRKREVEGKGTPWYFAHGHWVDMQLLGD